MTDHGSRRTIAELQARYTFEPSLRDVYVEGPSDRALLELGLESTNGSDEIRAYEIDTVDVPQAIVDSIGVPTGCKGRVLALAETLYSEVQRDLRANVVCLVDLDLDDLLGKQRDCPLLLYTTASSLDVVLAHEAVIRKLLSVVLLGFPISADALLAQLVPVLGERVLHRIATETLEIAVAPPPLVRFCSFNGHDLQFDAETFVRRHLQKAAAAAQESRFWQVVAEIRPRVTSKPHQYIPMDDFCDLLHFCVRTVKPRLVPEHDRFRRFLFGLVEAASVAALPEVREIHRRLSSPAA